MPDPFKQHCTNVKLPCLLQSDLKYSRKHEQQQLLQQVLCASDMDAEEEKLPGDSSTKSSSQVSKGLIGCEGSVPVSRATISISSGCYIHL